MILHHMDQKDMMSVWGLDSTSQKWNKLRANYALISVQMGTEARAHFFSPKMGNVESVIEIQHRFGAVYSEMAIQGMPKPDEVQARVLMTYPSNRWRQYVDNIAMRNPAPTVAKNFVRIKARPIIVLVLSCPHGRTISPGTNIFVRTGNYCTRGLARFR